MLRTFFASLSLASVAFLLALCGCKSRPSTCVARDAARARMSESSVAVVPTPEMWFYEQERATTRRSETDDSPPRRATRPAAAGTSGQPEVVRHSNSRPTVSPTPWFAGYSDHWGSNTYDPLRWRMPAVPLVVSRPARSAIRACPRTVAAPPLRRRTARTHRLRFWRRCPWRVRMENRNAAAKDGRDGAFESRPEIAGGPPRPVAAAHDLDADSLLMNAGQTTHVTGRHYRTGRPITLEIARGTILSVHDLADRRQRHPTLALDRSGFCRLAVERLRRPGIQLARADGRERRRDRRPASLVRRHAVLSDRDDGRLRHDRAQLCARLPRPAGGSSDVAYDDGRHSSRRSLHRPRRRPARRPSAGALPRARLERVRAFSRGRRGTDSDRHAVARVSRDRSSSSAARAAAAWSWRSVTRRPIRRKSARPSTPARS